MENCLPIKKCLGQEANGRDIGGCHLLLAPIIPACQTGTYFVVLNVLHQTLFPNKPIQYLLDFLSIIERQGRLRQCLLNTNSDFLSAMVSPFLKTRLTNAIYTHVTHEDVQLHCNFLPKYPRRGTKVRKEFPECSGLNSGTDLKYTSYRGRVMDDSYSGSCSLDQQYCAHCHSHIQSAFTH